MVGLAPSFDTVGWFAKSAEVMQQVGRVLLPPAPAPRPVGQVLLARGLFDAVDDGALSELATSIAIAVGTAVSKPVVEVDLGAELFKRAPLLTVAGMGSLPQAIVPLASSSCSGSPPLSISIVGNHGADAECLATLSTVAAANARHIATLAT